VTTDSSSDISNLGCCSKKYVITDGIKILRRKTRMTREEIESELKEDEERANGEILETAEDGISYYDYEFGTYCTYKYDTACTKEWLREHIRISDDVKENGVDAGFLADMLKVAYKDDFVDMMTTLRGIIIFSSFDDLKKFAKELC
jgi:hypothetical protein